MTKITIAGASGFIGTTLIEELKNTFKLKCLSRSKKDSDHANIQWSQADLYSLTDTIASFEDTDVAIFLVHSMLPASRLFQGNFQDTDLIIADNFIRACQIQGVKKIIYLGGVVPQGKLSSHLESRKEVEDAIINSGIDYTIIRAGMVVGNEGSSFEILKNLCLNLPFMILPKWTKNKTQVIFIDDLLKICRASIEIEFAKNKILNAVSGEDISYEELLKQTKTFLGKKLRYIRIPINYISFSKRWVSLFGHANISLVSPLVESLTCDLKNISQSKEIEHLVQYNQYRKMLEGLNQSKVERQYKTKNRQQNTVRSIQRLSHHHDFKIDHVVLFYFEWLPKHMNFLIKVETLEKKIQFKITGINLVLLELEYIQCAINERRAKFHIVGGLLSATKDTGWLEFRSVDNGKYLFASINEFRPALPWYIYCYSQAIAHKYVMKRFGEDLKYLEN